MKMADWNEFFSIGSIVACKTCHNLEIEGEVLAFDPQTKLLILKCPAANGQSDLNDIHVINLSYVSDLQVKKEVKTVPEQLQSLNLQMLNTRTRNNIEEKRRLLTSLAKGVPPEGQKLFLAINKTIGNVQWKGHNIVVWDSVTINPPYKVENLTGNCESKAFIHVKKIVEKYMKDQAAAEAVTLQTPSNTVPQ